MALNPIVFTEKVVWSFLRYQLTAYPLADERLHAQMRRLLSLDETRQSPLMKGPFISLSRPFRERAAVEALVREGVFHPHMRQRIPPEITHVYEEVCSREVMRTLGRQPRILLTNVKQLELLLTRQQDASLFADARLDVLVFDEAHTFSGAQGAETACLIRRLRAFCGRDAQDTVCVATSATIVDRERPDAARHFASRFFGVDPAAVVTVGEAFEGHAWSGERVVPAAPDTARVALSDGRGRPICRAGPSSGGA